MGANLALVNKTGPHRLPSQNQLEEGVSEKLVQLVWIAQSVCVCTRAHALVHKALNKDSPL